MVDELLRLPCHFVFVNIGLVVIAQHERVDKVHGTFYVFVIDYDVGNRGLFRCGCHAQPSHIFECHHHGRTYVDEELFSTIETVCLVILIFGVIHEGYYAIVSRDGCAKRIEVFTVLLHDLPVVIQRDVGMIPLFFLCDSHLQGAYALEHIVVQRIE